jgi:hypothetical protein
LVPVEPPTRRPSTFSTNRIVARDAASGTLIIRSITSPMNDGSTRGRPMPSMREPAQLVSDGSSSRHAAKNTEFSGSTTASRVRRRRYRT